MATHNLLTGFPLFPIFFPPFLLLSHNSSTILLFLPSVTFFIHYSFLLWPLSFFSLIPIHLTTCLIYKVINLNFINQPPSFLPSIPLLLYTPLLLLVTQWCIWVIGIYKEILIGGNHFNPYVCDVCVCGACVHSVSHNREAESLSESLHSKSCFK